MPLSNLLKSAAGTCRFCGQKAGVLSRSHSRLPPDPTTTGFQEMVALAAEAATHPPVRREDPSGSPWPKSPAAAFGDGDHRQPSP